MIKHVRQWGGGALLLLCISSAVRAAEGGSAPEAAEDAVKFSGTAGVFAKYNTNLNLNNGEEVGAGTKEAFIGEPTANLLMAKSWGPFWRLDVAYTGHANLHSEHEEENWYFNRTRLSLVRRLGGNGIHLTSELRHFTVPDRDAFDFARHTGILSYKHTLSPLWQLNVGMQNITTRYPQTRSLDYGVNGAFIEAHRTSSFNLSSYLSYDLQVYEGTSNPQEFPDVSAPEDGVRHTLRTGFDWLVSARQTLSGTYMYQIDTSESVIGLDQIGTVEGTEDSQDNDAEFDLKKHKATLLFSRRVNDKVTISAYEEFIIKAWEEEEEFTVLQNARDDLLFLSSLFVKYKWSDRTHLKFRYLFRTNDSSFSANDYIDHIVFVGPEVRF